jgi:hypothetical protein
MSGEQRRVFVVFAEVRQDVGPHRRQVWLCYAICRIRTGTEACWADWLRRYRCIVAAISTHPFATARAITEAGGWENSTAHLAYSL